MISFACSLHAYLCDIAHSLSRARAVSRLDSRTYIWSAIERQREREREKKRDKKKEY